MEIEQVIEILSLSPIYMRLSRDEQVDAVIYFCMAYENIKFEWDEN